jgi:hypothetical protein
MRWREQIKIVVIGLIAGGGGGLKILETVGDPSTWSGASVAFAGDPTPGSKAGTLRGGSRAASEARSALGESKPTAPGSPAITTQGPAPSKTPASPSGSATGAARSPRSINDPTDRIARFVREPYYYASLGRRDPFTSLLEGNFQGEGETGLVDIGNIKLVGIAWDNIDRFAMVEDGRGFGYVLREGDAIRGGRVLNISRESVTFAQSTAGESSTITIELPIREGD